MASPLYAGKVGVARADHSIMPEHLAMKSDENIDYVTMSKTSSPRALIFLYHRTVGYGIKLANIDGFTRAMSQVKWCTGNASGSTTVDLFKGPVANLLRLVVRDL
ncbi:La-related protein 6 [Hordeum vulgare]|nr:La-related protein 6 [Hordeum vulgare]